jgi:hypothetical protein
VLLYLFDTRPICRVKIAQLPLERLNECSEIYRGILLREGCRLLNEHKSVVKDRLEFVFRLPRRGARDRLHAALCDVPEHARGDVEWEVE